MCDSSGINTAIFIFLWQSFHAAKQNAVWEYYGCIFFLKWIHSPDYISKTFKQIQIQNWMYVNSFQNKYAQEICTWFKTYQVLKGTTIIPTVILTVGSQAIVNRNIAFT